jgi:hypothetical protein
VLGGGQSRLTITPGAPILVYWRRVDDHEMGNGALDTNRTCDLPLRRGLLYPLSYEGDVADFTRGRPLRRRDPFAAAPAKPTL